MPSETDRAVPNERRRPIPEVSPKRAGCFCPAFPSTRPVARRMSESSATSVSPAEIEARQDDLLRQLDELEKRIARVLADYAAYGQSPALRATNPSAGEIAQPPLAAKTPGVALPLSAAVVPATATMAVG